MLRYRTEVFGDSKYVLSASSVLVIVHRFKKSFLNLRALYFIYFYIVRYAIIFKFSVIKNIIYIYELHTFALLTMGT